MNWMLLSLLLSVLPMAAPDHALKSAPPKPALAARTVSACSAVTRSDVLDALGRLVSPGEPEAEPGASTCDYAGEGGQVSITVGHTQEFLDVAAEIDALKADLPQAQLREVKGIGTRAFFVDIPGAGTQLHVVRGQHDYLMVSVLGFGTAGQVSAAAEKLARRALARLA
ncbi:MAG TPA: hypothetical protein VHA11_08840 [Bryobacteraceae bacterium]|nr:hypothetical protein [Bryobacteraceae bacterium]